MKLFPVDKLSRKCCEHEKTCKSRFHQSTIPIVSYLLRRQRSIRLLFNRTISCRVPHPARPNREAQRPVCTLALRPRTGRSAYCSTVRQSILQLTCALSCSATTARALCWPQPHLVGVDPEGWRRRSRKGDVILKHQTASVGGCHICIRDDRVDALAHATHSAHADGVFLVYVCSLPLGACGSGPSTPIPAVPACVGDLNPVSLHPS